MVIERIGGSIASALEMMEKAYVHYCNRLLKAEKLIEKKSEESGYFADQVKRFSRDPRCSGLNLAAYLLIPFQRVTRYPLLVRKIAEHTPETHVDHEDVRNAVNVAETLCSRVNEGRRLYENRERLEWMQSHILLPEEIEIRFNSETKQTIHRELVHMGSLTKVNSGKELMAFLCNDFLLLTTPTRDVGKVSNLFASEKAMSATYKLYKRPYFLDEVEIVTTSPAPVTEQLRQQQQVHSSNPSTPSPSLADQEQALFDLWLGRRLLSLPHPSSSSSSSSFAASQESQGRKLISFRAIHANDKLYWLQKLTKSIRSYHENMHLIVKHDIRRSAVASHAVRLLVTVSEVQNLKFRHSSVVYFFVASLGSPGDLQVDHPQIESSAALPVTREHRASLAFDSLNESTSGSVRFEQSMRFFLSDEDIGSSSLVVSIYERTAFTPDVLVGAGQLSVAHVRQTLSKTTGRPLLLTLLLSSLHRHTTGSMTNGKNLDGSMTPKILIKVDLL